MNFAWAEPETIFSMGEAPAGYSEPRQIKYSFDLKNKKADWVENVDFWVYAPVAQTATQWSQTLVLSHPAELITDELGNQILHFHFKRLAPDSRTTVRIKADLLIASEPQPVHFADVDEQFLAPSRYIQSHDPVIAQAARKFKGRSVLETAQRINNWTALRLKDTRYTRGHLGARYAMQHEKGDCTESADLFAALARANDIPARTLGGYICPQNTVLSAKAYHNWAEFYDGFTWRLADPNARKFNKQQGDAIVLSILNNTEDSPLGSQTRFRVQGDGIHVEMN
jgi:transglutaminase-like putative cysteine protease